MPIQSCRAVNCADKGVVNYAPTIVDKPQIHPYNTLTLNDLSLNDMGTHYKGTERQKRALNGFIALMRAAESVSSRTRGGLDQAGLSESQFGVLEAIYHIGPMCQREIATKLLRSGGNITMVVDNLESEQLVKRTRSTEDRRMLHVGLTEKGRTLIKKILPEHIEQIVFEMSELTSDEQVELKRLCRKLGLREKETHDQN